MRTGKAIIEVENVTCRFGQVTAVEDVTLAIEEGTIFGLVGSDGAGKSTLLRMMATMIPPTSGRIVMDGLDVVSEKRSVKTLIGYMPQRFGLYQDLTVEENLRLFHGHLRDRPRREDEARGSATSASPTSCPLPTARRESSPGE